MKKDVSFIVCLAVASICTGFVYSAEAKEKNDAGSPAKHVLMLGLSDNVKSNYFYKGLIAEETGIKENVIGSEYNAIIMENIVEQSKGECVFIPVFPGQTDAMLEREIKVNGEGDECYSDISSVPAEEFQQALATAGADYLLVLNQHYLKWQETPLRTLFHIVSYTLFDKDKKEVCRGNHYFTCMNLERSDRLRKISRKASARIASAIMSQVK
ncbi:hypothetical protein AGMMS49574_28900 [Bacteroidia bacterium]|nr:hypothetical protein AGMMS49574_28900 [Bacteroidia bacterium]